MAVKENHLLKPPKTERLRAKLALKLEEYKARIAGEGKPWEFDHPELAHITYRSYRDACYKAYILEKLLSSTETIDTWKLSEELPVKWKQAFDVAAFSSACGVISAYSGNTSEQVFGGTGLPKWVKPKSSEK